MTMRRLMLPSALLYESIEDFKYDVASVICSSPLKIVLVTFPEPINNDKHIQNVRDYLLFPEELRRGGCGTAKYCIHAVRTSIARLITMSHRSTSSGSMVVTLSSPSC